MKQTKVVYTERKSERGTRLYSLFYLDQRRQAAFAFCLNRP